MPITIFNGSFQQYRGSISIGPFLPSAGGGGEGTSIVTSTLTHWFDAGTGSSYPGTGDKWNNLITTGNSSGSQLWFPNGFTYVDAGASSYFVMDGVNDYIRTTGSTNNRPLITSGTFTINIVCRFVNTGSGATNRFISWDGAQAQLLIDTNLANAEAYPAFSGSSGFFDRIVELVPGNVAARNQNVMLTYTSTYSGSVKLYVNGDLFGSTTSWLDIGTSLGPYTIYLWADSNGSTVRDSGSISHFMFYTSSLSDAQILQNYDALKTRYSLP